MFFDDNAWLVFGLLEMYAARQDEALLDKAEQVQAFIYSGWQEDLGGGLLWREFDKETTARCGLCAQYLHQCARGDVRGAAL